MCVAKVCGCVCESRFFQSGYSQWLLLLLVFISHNFDFMCSLALLLAFIIHSVRIFLCSIPCLKPCKSRYLENRWLVNCK
jgi:hypothetical protein